MNRLRSIFQTVVTIVLILNCVKLLTNIVDAITVMILMPVWKPPKPQCCGYNYGCSLNCNLKPWISCEIYWVPYIGNQGFGYHIVCDYDAV